MPTASPTTTKIAADAATATFHRRGRRAARAGASGPVDVARLRRGSARIGPQARRKVSTASTRLWSSSAGGRSSLEKMLVTCFSMARSVITSWVAIA